MFKKSRNIRKSGKTVVTTEDDSDEEEGPGKSFSASKRSKDDSITNKIPSKPRVAIMSFAEDESTGSLQHFKKIGQSSINPDLLASSSDSNSMKAGTNSIPENYSRTNLGGDYSTEALSALRESQNFRDPKLQSVLDGMDGADADFAEESLVEVSGEAAEALENFMEGNNRSSAMLTGSAAVEVNTQINSQSILSSTLLGDFVPLSGGVNKSRVRSVKRKRVTFGVGSQDYGQASSGDEIDNDEQGNLSDSGSDKDATDKDARDDAAAADSKKAASLSSARTLSSVQVKSRHSKLATQVYDDIENDLEEQKYLISNEALLQPLVTTNINAAGSGIRTKGSGYFGGGVGTAKGTSTGVLTLDEVKKSLQSSLDSVNEALEHTRSRIESLKTGHLVNLSKEKEKLEEKMKDGVEAINFVQHLRVYLAEVVGMLRDKAPLVEELRIAALKVHENRGNRLRERRTRYQENILEHMLRGKDALAIDIGEYSPVSSALKSLINKQLADEGEQSRDIRSEFDGDAEVNVNDDEVYDTNNIMIEKLITIRDASVVLFEDCESELLSIQNIVSKMVNFRSSFPSRFSAAYIDLSLPGLLAPLVLSNIIPSLIFFDKKDGQGEGLSSQCELDKMDWYRALLDYSNARSDESKTSANCYIKSNIYDSGSNLTAMGLTTVDTEVLPKLIMDTALPWFIEMVSLTLDPLSEHQCSRCVSIISTILEYDPPSKLLLQLIKTVTEVFQDFLKSECKPLVLQLPESTLSTNEIEHSRKTPRSIAHLSWQSALNKRMRQIMSCALSLSIGIDGKSNKGEDSGYGGAEGLQTVRVITNLLQTAVGLIAFDVKVENPPRDGETSGVIAASSTRRREEAIRALVPSYAIIEAFVNIGVINSNRDEAEAVKADVWMRTLRILDVHE